MKVSFYFALREMRRRPRRMLSLVLVTVAILTALNLMLFYLEADWRQQVMPESPTSYHFHIRCVDDFDTVRGYIKKQPWVQAWYEEDIHDYYDEEYKYTEFRVRVDWEHVLVSSKLAWEMFDELDLWNSTYYAENYEHQYNDSLAKLKTSTLNAPYVDGVPIEQAAVGYAKSIFIDRNTRNSGFCRLTINNYVIRPEFAMYMSMFSLFLGSTMAILFSEQYRSDMKEFGSLRALGLKKWQLAAINCIENLTVSLVSVPIATLFSFTFVKLYVKATSVLDTSSVYMTLTDNVPLGAMIIVSLMLTVVSLLGCFAVCMFYRERTVMDMLRGIETLRVSFVSKTSPRFDKATSLGIYDLLYLIRTRTSQILGALVIAFMMPLPLMFIWVVIGLIGTSINSGSLISVIYHAVQAVMISVTAMTVTFVSLRSAADSRSREFAALRALGTPKRRILRTAYTIPFIQTAVILVIAAAAYVNMSDSSMTVSSLPRPNVDPTVQAAKLTVSALGTSLLVFPPMLVGVYASLRRFFKRSTIENLRETE